MARSYKVGVKTAGDRDWVSNSIRYATHEEASLAGANLAMRWILVQDWTVLESDDEPNGVVLGGQS
jgi:hypothetical protein